jgi:large subunit ribosomal protein L23
MGVHLEPEQIIIAPVVTEKTNLMREKHKYVFKVDARANKPQIMRAVEKLFNVHPLGCNVIRVSRKPKRVRYRIGYTAAWKKAIVTLPPGEAIQVFEGA